MNALAYIKNVLSFGFNNEQIYEIINNTFVMLENEKKQNDTCLDAFLNAVKKQTKICYTIKEHHFKFIKHSILEGHAAINVFSCCGPVFYDDYMLLLTDMGDIDKSVFVEVRKFFNIIVKRSICQFIYSDFQRAHNFFNLIENDQELLKSIAYTIIQTVCDNQEKQTPVNPEFDSLAAAAAEIIHSSNPGPLTAASNRQLPKAIPPKSNVQPSRSTSPRPLPPNPPG